MKDGFNLTYIKDDIMYPVGLSADENCILQEIVPSLLGSGSSIKVFIDKPMGEVIHYGGKGE